MPRTAIPVVNPNKNAGGIVAPTAADNGNGMSFVNDGDTLLMVEGTGAITVTVKSVADALGRTGDVVQILASGDLGQFGPLDPGGFNQADGTVNVDLTSANGKVYAVRHKR